MLSQIKVIAISKNVHQKIRAPKLQPPSKLLNGPTKHSLELLGEFEGHLKHKHKGVVHPIFVVKRRLKTNFVGHQAIISLELACRLNQIESRDWLSKYLTI